MHAFDDKQPCVVWIWRFEFRFEGLGFGYSFVDQQPCDKIGGGFQVSGFGFTV